MSRIVEVKISESVSVKQDDCYKSKLNLSPILNKTRMSEITKEVLKSANFVINGKNASCVLMRGDEEEVITMDVDTETGDITITASVDSNVMINRTVRGDSDDSLSTRRKLIDNVIKAELSVINYETKIRLTRMLERYMSSFDSQINSLVDKIMKKSLVEKARSMGEIMSVSEEENGGMMIKLRV